MASLFKPSSRSAPPPCQSRSGLLPRHGFLVARPTAAPAAPPRVVQRQVVPTGGSSNVQQPHLLPLRLVGEATVTVINPAGLGFPAREQLPVITVHNRHAHQLAKDVVYDQATTGAIKEVYTALGAFSNGTQEMPSLGRGAGAVLQEVADKCTKEKEEEKQAASILGKAALAAKAIDAGSQLLGLGDDRIVKMRANAICDQDPNKLYMVANKHKDNQPSGKDTKEQWQRHRSEVKSLTNLSARIYHLYLVDGDGQELIIKLGPGDTVYMCGDVLKLVYHWAEAQDGRLVIIRASNGSIDDVAARAWALPWLEDSFSWEPLELLPHAGELVEVPSFTSGGRTPFPHGADHPCYGKAPANAFPSGSRHPNFGQPPANAFPSGSGNPGFGQPPANAFCSGDQNCRRNPHAPLPEVIQRILLVANMAMPHVRGAGFAEMVRYLGEGLDRQATLGASSSNQLQVQPHSLPAFKLEWKAIINGLKEKQPMPGLSYSKIPKCHPSYNAIRMNLVQLRAKGKLPPLAASKATKRSGQQPPPAKRGQLQAPRSSGTCGDGAPASSSGVGTGSGGLGLVHAAADTLMGGGNGGQQPPPAKRGRLQAPRSSGTCGDGAPASSSGVGTGSGGLGLAHAAADTLMGGGNGGQQPPPAKRGWLQAPRSSGTCGDGAPASSSSAGLSIAEMAALCDKPRPQPSAMEVDRAMKALKDWKPPPAPPGSIPMHLRPAALQAMIVAIQEGLCPKEAAAVFVTEVVR
ncbi:hypothetical protein CHLRE_22g754197v5 [Chlamydomonas reinhardtii]|uniref:Uncharacterized protein n=1 Tax=Chlamydomonas reinhardtii TaxID=3055 RepID=A0A2K3CN67_CHLRE|nr:uncharacterized protein CHLRE_22g754197v5 [Chlamydomonas reinhardtii]PNW69742.1 hypothetical protein CHLRE_22g754197v5 [Chlamydomonas reinhardtii]